MWISLRTSRVDANVNIGNELIIENNLSPSPPSKSPLPTLFVPITTVPFNSPMF